MPKGRIKGSKLSEETKKKMSLSHKGIKVWNKGKKGVYNKETLEKLSEAKRGEKAPSWKGGISFELYPIDWT